MLTDEHHGSAMNGKRTRHLTNLLQQQIQFVRQLGERQQNHTHPHQNNIRAEKTIIYTYCLVGGKLFIRQLKQDQRMTKIYARQHNIIYNIRMQK